MAAFGCRLMTSLCVLSSTYSSVCGELSRAVPVPVLEPVSLTRHHLRPPCCAQHHHIAGCNNAVNVLNSLDLVQYVCKGGQCVPSAKGVKQSDCENTCVPDTLYVCNTGRCTAANDGEHGVPIAECQILCQTVIPYAST